MKQVSHKIASLLMAFVVLFSTLSFTVDMHFCGETLVDTALFHKARTCGMETQNPSSSDACSMSKKNCCSDKQLVIEGQNELQLSFDSLSFEQQQFVVAFVYTYSTLFEGLDCNLSSFETYKPPRVIRQLFKLDETYLI